MSTTTKPAPPTKVNVNNIQGDVLSGLPKKTQTFMFFKITNGKQFVADLVKLVPLIQTVAQSLKDRDDIDQHKKAKKPGLIPMAGANISLTKTGLDAMGFTAAMIANTALTEATFQKGAIADAPSLNDPLLPSTQTPDWEQEFLNGIDGLLLVAGSDHDSVQKKIAQIQKVFPADPNHSSITIVKTITGDVRPGDQSGHEHFGFLDGISNPLIAGFDKTVPGPTPIDASNVLTGYTQANDWTQDGSFLVFRYLLQKVPEFNNFLDANRLQNDPITSASLTEQQGSDLLGARLVGRWKSGAPIDISPFQDDPTLANNLQQRNNFDYANEFRDNNKCPWAAHIRRTNPRTDSTRKGPIDNRRIMRRGIAFGPEVNDAEASSGTTQQDRGLLFACYQANITNAFRFIQTLWANNPTFPFIGADIKPPTPLTPGVDPLIGQVAAGQPRQMSGYDPLTANDPDQKPLSMETFIVPRGGAYLFVPPIKLLREFNRHITSS
ncbi:hypothetical protein NP233_g7137 [Leucocoprinus birnbaumii]|uniref:Uncharacterized protein n=1 Tax=Leucocoprinus birnbaumii TaxID=56174 RepID=A0AAD5VQV3_9AGAR|nr:hypothetical protein NP233_g7137 [Leucocoprinus birnbaumii]